MCVAKHLLNMCDEFYAAVSPMEQRRNQGLNLLLRKVKANIEHGLNGFSDDQELLLVVETITDFNELMDQISKEERIRNRGLQKCFRRIRRNLKHLKIQMSCGWEFPKPDYQEVYEWEADDIEPEHEDTVEPDSECEEPEEASADEEDFEDEEEEDCECGLSFCVC